MMGNINVGGTVFQMVPMQQVWIQLTVPQIHTLMVMAILAVVFNDDGTKVYFQIHVKGNNEILELPLIYQRQVLLVIFNNITPYSYRLISGTKLFIRIQRKNMPLQQI